MEAEMPVREMAADTTGDAIDRVTKKVIKRIIYRQGHVKVSALRAFAGEG